MIGPHGVGRFPQWSTSLNSETELTIVIGRTASADSAEDASAHISARALTIGEERTPRQGDKFSDRLAGKWFDTFAAFGPRDHDGRRLARSTPIGALVDRQWRASPERLDRGDAVQPLRDCLVLVTSDDARGGCYDRDRHGLGCRIPIGTFLKPGAISEATIETLGTLHITMPVA